VEEMDMEMLTEVAEGGEVDEDVRVLASVIPSWDANFLISSKRPSSYSPVRISVASQTLNAFSSKHNPPQPLNFMHFRLNCVFSAPLSMKNAPLLMLQSLGGIVKG